jgi:hypothetical protein
MNLRDRGFFDDEGRRRLSVRHRDGHSGEDEWQRKARTHGANTNAILDVPVHTSDTLEQTLARYWGFDTFRPLQREAMDAILAGRDSLVVLPTGGG